MALLVYLAIATLLSVATYMLSKGTIWKHRRALLDPEKSMALSYASSEKPVGIPSNAWQPASSGSPSETDQQAANAQLLAEFAASYDASAYPAKDRVVVSTEPPSDEPVILVNPKQYHRILKRRIFRQEFAEALQKTQRATMQARTSRRSKVKEGTMVALS